ncbi:MAG TPA: excinuclease ABC subunit UvrA, partial [Alphaproteobacteria bacterium]
EPRLFSFNSPHGACPSCDGLGEKLYMDERLIVPDASKSLAKGAIAPWSKSFAPFYMQALEAVAKHYKFNVNTPWEKLTKAQRDIVLYGSGDDDIKITYHSKTESTWKSNKPFEGVIPSMQRRMLETDSESAREDLAKYQSTMHCEACNGARLKPEALAVKVAKRHISEATEMSIEDAQKWFADLPKHLSKKHNEIAIRVLKEINDRLTFLLNVGLEYLSLDRASGTLSGGESQRIRLASQIGSGLTGVLYVLDEPSIGLHQRDNHRLLETLRRLRDLGNTVLVVEHDEDAIRSADYLIDMGPGAGVHGGEIVAIGTPEQVFKNKDSVTADYMTGRKSIEVPSERRPGKTGQFISIIGATGHNLKNVNVDIPIGAFTCVTGVSGSGKSTLVNDTLYMAILQAWDTQGEVPAPHKAIKGLEFIDKIVDIDQSPIGRTPRSNPATYTGAFTPIREWFAGLPEAKARGYDAGRFSFNVKGGRCETCQGDGVLKIEMHFLPDVYVTCDACHGKRYNRETLEVKYRDKSISDVLDMTIEDASQFFKAVPSIRNKMEVMEEVGLGYIQVGQAATTLSGGEAQRVKLSKELSRRGTGKTLYILDEPTTGLHFEDVRKLLEVLHQLVDQGNTVLVIEHNLDVIKTADWIIDIGPEGGNKGGEVIATGTPEDIADVKQSYTGQFLKPLLKNETAVAPKKKRA